MNRNMGFFSVLLCLLLLFSAAHAEIWEGSVVTGDIADITAAADGVLTVFNLKQGQTVNAGDYVGETRLTSWYAPVSGVIAAIHEDEGDDVDGTILEISPKEQYIIDCSISGAQKTAENTFVHAGERVYVKCTVDGTHRALGRVTTISGDSFKVEVKAGELYIGETVYVYRRAAFMDRDRIGSGTVAETDNVICTGSGNLIALAVAEGEPVERGQLLYSMAPNDEVVIRAEDDGVITEILAARGDDVTEDQVLARVAVTRKIRVDASEEDAAGLEVGRELTYIRADDLHETKHKAVVTRILDNVEDATVTAEMRPEEADLPIGLSVTVTDEEESDF